MPPARACSGTERIAILDGDVRALTAAARTASVSASVGVSSSWPLVVQGREKAVARHHRLEKLCPTLLGWPPLSRTKVPGPEVESCSPRLHRLARVKRVGRLRAVAWALATGPAANSLLLQGSPRARGDSTSVEQPRTRCFASHRKAARIVPRRLVARSAPHDFIVLSDSG